MSFELTWPAVATWVINRMAEQGDVLGYADNWMVAGAVIQGPIILVAEDEIDIATLPKEIEGITVTYVAMPRPVPQDTSV